MARYEVDVEVNGPWSLATSRKFWADFAPAPLADQGAPPGDSCGQLRSVFLIEDGWRRAEVTVNQHGSTARLVLTGTGDLEVGAAQVCRFLSLDIDAREWPRVARRDPVIAQAQKQLKGLRPCGFHSPYEAAAWSVLSQRIRTVQAARMRHDLIERHGQRGAFPSPASLRGLDLDLPGRKTEYLRAVAEAALEGRLDGPALRSMPLEQAITTVQEVKGLGPFAAELVVIRGANAPDVLPRHERRLETEISEQYGPDRTLAQVSDAWRPFRSWAAVYLRTLREERTGEIGAPTET